MGSIPVLNDQQMAALRRVTGTNQSFKLIPAAKAKSRRLPTYDGEESVNAVEYNGYFTIKKRLIDDAIKIVVCDGATYNETSGSSVQSICRVNNNYYYVDSQTLDPVVGKRQIIIAFNKAESGRRGYVSVEQLEDISEEERPSYLIGEYTFDGSVLTVIQRHGTSATQFMANGIAYIEYFYQPCP